VWFWYTQKVRPPFQGHKALGNLSDEDPPTYLFDLRMLSLMTGLKKCGFALAKRFLSSECKKRSHEFGKLEKRYFLRMTKTENFTGGSLKNRGKYRFGIFETPYWAKTDLPFRSGVNPLKIGSIAVILPWVTIF